MKNDTKYSSRAFNLSKGAVENEIKPTELKVKTISEFNKTNVSAKVEETI